MHLGVRLSVGSFIWPKLTFELGNFSLIYIVNSKFCRHYSSKTVRHSILIFIYVIPNILKLCTLVSVCPSVRLFGQNWRLNLGNFSLIYIVNSKSCRHYSDETVRRSILIFMYVIPNILKFCTLVSVCPSVRLIGQNWRLNLGNFSLIYILNTKSCRHYSSETVRRSILIFIYAIPNILKLCTLVSVCPSVRLIGQNWRLNLGNFSLIYIVNTKSCRHYSSETVRRSILIFIYVIPNILKLCTLVFACPSARLFGPKSTSELRPFFTSYLGHIVLAFTNALLYVTGISSLQNHFMSLTLRPGGAYVFRPDTFLVF